MNHSIPPSVDASIALGFALMLETACEDFEILQRLITGDTKICSDTGQADCRAQVRTTMALAKSFVFHVVRAHRICEQGASSLPKTVGRLDRKQFINATRKVISVRNVNEHGFDVNGSPKPSLHSHERGLFKVDETSMIVQGHTKIILGPLNLCEIYPPTDRMRKLAGFSSLYRGGWKS